MKHTRFWKGAPRAASIAVTLALTLGAAPPVALAATQATAAVQAAPATQGKPTIVVLGDSLSAEYGLPRDTGWVALMRERIAQQRLDYSVANASVSGDTTSGGLARLPALISRLKPAIVVVELGANDALRGVPLATTEQNLRGIVAMAQRAKARVVLVGMYVPPNYGLDYTQKFQAMYATLAKQEHLPLVPFLLAGIENRRDQFQDDQMHPNQGAQPALLDNVWPVMKPLLGARS